LPAWSRPAKRVTSTSAFDRGGGGRIGSQTSWRERQKRQPGLLSAQQAIVEPTTCNPNQEAWSPYRPIRSRTPVLLATNFVRIVAPRSAAIIAVPKCKIQSTKTPGRPGRRMVVAPAFPFSLPRKRRPPPPMSPTLLEQPRTLRTTYLPWDPLTGGPSTFAVLQGTIPKPLRAGPRRKHPASDRSGRGELADLPRPHRRRDSIVQTLHHRHQAAVENIQIIRCAGRVRARSLHLQFWGRPRSPGLQKSAICHLFRKPGQKTWALPGSCRRLSLFRGGLPAKRGQAGSSGRASERPRQAPTVGKDQKKSPCTSSGSSACSAQDLSYLPAALHTARYKTKTTQKHRSPRSLGIG